MFNHLVKKKFQVPIWDTLGFSDLTHQHQQGLVNSVSLREMRNLPWVDGCRRYPWLNWDRLIRHEVVNVVDAATADAASDEASVVETRCSSGPPSPTNSEDFNFEVTQGQGGASSLLLPISPSQDLTLSQYESNAVEPNASGDSFIPSTAPEEHDSTNLDSDVLVASRNLSGGIASRLEAIPHTTIEVLEGGTISITIRPQDEQTTKRRRLDTLAEVATHELGNSVVKVEEDSDSEEEFEFDI